MGKKAVARREKVLEGGYFFTINLSPSIYDV